MKRIINFFSTKEKPRRYPMPEAKVITIKKKETPIELILAIIIAVCLGLAMSACSPSAKLPNGCPSSKYKKFTA